MSTNHSIKIAEELGIKVKQVNKTTDIKIRGILTTLVDFAWRYLFALLQNKAYADFSNILNTHLKVFLIKLELKNP